jgi:hypothetical protein
MADPKHALDSRHTCNLAFNDWLVQLVWCVPERFTWQAGNGLGTPKQHLFGIRLFPRDGIAGWPYSPIAGFQGYRSVNIRPRLCISAAKSTH